MGRTKWFGFMLIVALAGILVQSVLAVPPKPGIYDPETMTFYENGQPVPREPTDYGVLPARGTYRGTFKFPVLFACANDQSWTYSVQEWAEQLFTVGTFPTGSMRDYYREISYDNFDVEGVALGWITLDHPYVDYHQNNFGFNGGAAAMVREAVVKAEDLYNPDWSQFDNDHDGQVDGVVVIHMGPGGENGADPKLIWSHVSYFDALELDGVTLSKYSIQPERKNTGQMETIGTLCHEHGHVLGLPDLYDVDYTAKDAPVGPWAIMASGSDYGEPPGSTPRHMTGWSRYQLGWVDEVIIDESGTYTANAVELSKTNSVFILPINGAMDEYFLLENRYVDSGSQFDQFSDIFDGGLLVYHVDENMKGSNSGNLDHFRVSVEDAEWHANPTDEPMKKIYDAPFNAESGNTEFSPITVPGSDGYYMPSNITIKNIGSTGAAMDFTILYQPTLILEKYEIIPLGEDNFELLVTLKDISYGPASNVTAVIATDSASVILDKNTAEFGNIPKDGGLGVNTTDPYKFRTTGSEGSLETFTLVASADGGYTSTTLMFTIPVNPSRILIVDDDQTQKGQPQEIQMYFEEALDILQYNYETWEVLTHGYPSADIMSLYDLVVWSDGKAATNAPSGAALDEIQRFLDMGGDLFFSSHEFIYSQHPYSQDDPGPEFISFPADSFCHKYLHLNQCEQDEYLYEATGVPGSMFDGITFTFDDVFTTGQNIGWWPDEFITDDQATPILTAGSIDCSHFEDEDDIAACEDDNLPETNMIEHGAVALTYQGEYRLMFMSIPVHGLSTTTEAPNNRQYFMQKVFDWFGVSPDSPSIDIDVNQQVFHAGDTFKLSMKIDNPGPAVEADVFVLLDVFSDYYYFWPAWTADVSFETRTLESGYDTFEYIFDPFEWPEGAGAADDIRMWAALLKHNTSELLGTYDFTPLTYE